MSNITEIDKNFVVNIGVDVSDMDLYSALDEPFSVHGLILPTEDEKVYRRLPAAIAEKVSDPVTKLSKDSAGGRVRFKTNSSSVIIIAKMIKAGGLPHQALCGAAGFDLYADNNYAGSFIPPLNITDGFAGEVNLQGEGMHEITINFPVFSKISELTIGLKKGSVVEKATPYSNEKPIVYYGSSITQGGCASRPGNTYQAIISRKLNLDYLNLGFSGAAKAEDAIVDYMSALDMSLFVCDYDHNAPTEEYLIATHKPLYEKIRNKNPHLPILFISRPNDSPNIKQAKNRFEIINDTYKYALLRGDKNVYIINGLDMFNYLDKNSMTVDGIHPNDFGFWCMSEVIGKKIKEIFEK